MNTVVRFEKVSKQYRLGVSRSSIPGSVSNGLKRLLKPGANNDSKDQLLWALRDVSFELSRGESLALVGRNGAGKSTILKLLANITRPTSGRIDLDGRLSALIELGTGFHPDLTGRENIYLNGAVLGLNRSEIQKRFDEIVDFSEIEQFIDTPVKRYSSGMLVRLGFSVASCIEPDILLVDEVLAVGDASFRQKCLIRIQALLNQGTSLIFVSHNINMVESICVSALYIKSGQIVDRGKTVDVIATYERDLHEERAMIFDEESYSRQVEGLTNVEIKQVAILNINSSSASEYRGDQPVEIQVHYLAQRPIEKADAVFRIIRSDGLTCCMLRTAIDSVSLSLLEGEGIFSVMLDPLQLIGGAYYVDAYISTERDLVLLATGRSNWFYVSGSPLSIEEQSGVFEPVRKWMLQPREPLSVGEFSGDGRSMIMPEYTQRSGSRESL